MDSSEIDAVLDRADQSVAEGTGLTGTGFWGAVAHVKRDPALVEEHADRIAAIDRAALAAWALFSLPIGIGTFLMLVATGVGFALIAVAYFAEGLIAVVVFYAGLTVLLTTTHGLAHLAVGRAVGIRFSDWFVASLFRPQPGVKVDYSSYLRAPAAGRAWMHASGALATKVVPFSLIGAASAAALPDWAIVGLPVIGIVTIMTDILWSTKSSDWKKFKREMSLAQS